MRPLFFKKVNFSKNERRLGHSTILTLRGPQDGAKIGPRSSQEGHKIDLKHDRFSRRFFDRFLFVLGSFWVPFGVPSWSSKSTLGRARLGHCWSWADLMPSTAFKTDSRRPKTAQERPPTPLQSPKRPPRRPKMTPNDLQDTQNDPQDDQTST